MYSFIALAGPKSLLSTVSLPDYDKRVDFPTPEDHGGFPDLRGESMANFHEIVVTGEDPSLYKYMLKCVDAVDDWGNKKMKSLELLGFRDIVFTMNGHTYGGRVFAVAGFVKHAPMKVHLGGGVVIH